MRDIAAVLAAQGMSHHSAAAKARLFAMCADRHHYAEGAIPVFAPGRIELLGKHTDYAGGRSLLCAMERGFVALVSPRTDAVVHITAADSGHTRMLPLTDSASAPQGDWANYAAAVVRSVARNFPSATTGADITFASDLPASSGMSSSSALLVMIFLALDAVNDLDADSAFRSVITSREVLGGYLGAVENGRSFGPFAGDSGVGTMGGSQDQTAILCCRAGMVSQYAFHPVRFEGEMALPRHKSFVVAFSGVAASKTAHAMEQYNEASGSVSEIVRLWNEFAGRSDPSLADAIAASSPGQLRELLARSEHFTAQRLEERLAQFSAEAFDIIPSAAAALRLSDWTRFGELVDQSQANAENLLGNQIPETVFLARSARELGAHAASAFGAGFGGSVWALVDTHSASTFTDAWRSRYASSFPDAAARADVFVTSAGPPAEILRDIHD